MFFILRLLVLVVVTLNTHAALPKAFFFFGDSLSDSGYQNNNPILKRTGKTPLLTSPGGHTWAYYFLQHHASDFPRANTTLLPNNLDAAALFNPVPAYILPTLDGNNFAAGGSTTKGVGVLNNENYKSPSLLEQIEYFINVHASKHSIVISQNEYLIWSGGNDVMRKLIEEVGVGVLLQKMHLSNVLAAFHLFNVQKLSSRFMTIEKHVSDNLLTAVTLLQDAGAKKIVVILLPDLGKTPLIASLIRELQQVGSSMTTDELSAEMSAVTCRINALIRKKLTGTSAVFVDVNQALEPLVLMKSPGLFKEDPTLFGSHQVFLIENNKDGACSVKAVALTCVPSVKNAAHYVFEDLGHPTDQTHQIIGDYVYYQSQKALSLMP